jgi:hypothetical protein
MSEMDLAQALALRQKLADWSDAQLRDARAFVQSHKSLIPRDLTNAQLHGFLNVVRNSTKVEDIKLFMQNQALKADRAGRSKEKMRDFWLAMQSRGESFMVNAAEIARELDQKWAKDSDRIALIYRQLLQKYLQHVIAEKLVVEKSDR